MATEKKMQELIGKTLGGYQIVEQIGKGGMAAIFRAFQPSLDREVAIKVMQPYFVEQDESFHTRFRREAKAIAKLRHPNILVVIDFGEEGEYPYIVMEYVPAGTLKDRMAEGPMSLREVSTLLGQVAGALDYAHGEGVVHRDIKPSNILMPKKDWALLTDFGLARMVGGSMLTQSGMTVGTPAYMSPEQGGGEQVDHRTDIYSLGVILYEMVVGEVPYTAETPMAVVVKHIVDPLPMPRARKPDLPEEVQRVILKALAKNPADRYQKAGELAEALALAVTSHADWSSGDHPTVKSVPVPTSAATGVMPREAAMAAVLGGSAPAETAAAVTAPSAAAPRKPGRAGLWALGGVLVLAVLALAALGGRALLGGLRGGPAAGGATTPGETAQPPADQPSGGQPAGGQPAGNQPPQSFGGLPLPPPPELTDHPDPMAAGQEMLAAGDVEGAAAAFYQAMTQVPATYVRVRDLAHEYSTNGDPATAARLMEVALVTQPRPNLDDLEYLGYYYGDAEQYQRAYEVFLFLVGVRPDDTWLFYSLVDDAESSGRLDDALAALDGIRGRFPNNANFPFAMGMIQSRQGRLEEAVALLREATELDPGQWDAFVELAYPLYQLGRYDEVEAALNYVAGQAPDDGGVQDWIAWEFLDYEMYDQAIRHFRRAIELAPNYAWSPIGLADALVQSGQHLEEVPGLYDRAHRLGMQERDPYVSLSAGWGFYNLGNCDRAVEIWNDILSYQPDFPEALDALGDCGQ
jgi:tetratricopeptide (TPR) repeat protein/tRNA A-37 threonylcarbamoyl transferase component Bud32